MAIFKFLFSLLSLHALVLLVSGAALNQYARGLDPIPQNSAHSNVDFPPGIECHEGGTTCGVGLECQSITTTHDTHGSRPQRAIGRCLPKNKKGKRTENQSDKITEEKSEEKTEKKTDQRPEKEKTGGCKSPCPTGTGKACITMCAPEVDGKKDGRPNTWGNSL